MWILPTRSRPHNIDRLLRIYVETNASTPVWMRIDEDDPLVKAYSVNHPNWSVTVGRRKPLSDIYAEAFERFKNATFFGFIGDDVIPKTNKWDARLIEIAGSDGMSYPSGGHEDYSGAPHFVLGGDLVREIGWLALPGLDRLYIDQTWHDIAEFKGVLRHVPEVVLFHKHFSNGGALMDRTYRKFKKAEDKAIYENWRLNGYNQLIQKGENHGNST